MAAAASTIGKRINIAGACASGSLPSCLELLVCSDVPGLREGVKEAVSGAKRHGLNFNVTYATPRDGEILTPAVPTAHVIVGEPVAVGPLLPRAESLLWYQSTFAGVDAIMPHVGDSPSYVCTRMGQGMSEVMAEWVLMMTLAHERKLPEMVRAKDRGEWVYSTTCRYRKLNTLTMVILGAGTLGAATATAAKALGMHTVGLRRRLPLAGETETGPFDEVCTSLEEVLPKADVLVSLLPSTSATRGLLSGDTLKLCSEKSPVLINGGRGDVIDEESIVAALDNGWLSGATLDVFLKEPLPGSSPLWTHPKVTISPHVAAVSFATDVVDVFTENLGRWAEGKEMQYEVDLMHGY